MDQVNFIKRQYVNVLKGKQTITAMNSNLQKYFDTSKDFTEVIAYCIDYNKGYSPITWEVA